MRALRGHSRDTVLLFGPLFLAALAALACGGSGSPTEPPPPPPPGPSITFTPDQTAPASSFALRRGPGSGGSVLELELVARTVPPVRELDLGLAFPATLLRFADLRAGTFFGGNVSLIVQGNVALLQISIGRTVPGTSSGDGVVLTVRFDGIAEGQGRIDIIAPEARDGDDLAVGGLRWIAGRVAVDL